MSVGATDQQITVAAKEKLADLKGEYMRALRAFVDGPKMSDPPVYLTNFLNCQQTGNRYFNYAEEFVGNSGLLGAHAHGLWLTGFAEDCAEILRSIPQHYIFLREHASHVGLESAAIEPGPRAYANMQRLVVAHTDENLHKSLKADLALSNIPVYGFEHPAMSDTPKAWEKITSISIGVGFLLLIVVIVLFLPHPSPFQQLVLRGVFALGAAAFGVIIPGLLDVKMNAKGFAIRATGTIALFIIIWMINPPALVT